MDDALGRILAEDLVSSINVPPFANSAMDGFALRSEDTRSPAETVTLRVAGTVQAGAGDLPHVAPGEAFRIMTGAPLPPGADTVVPFEETTSAEDRVTVPANRTERAAVRPAGLDVKSGDLVLTRGTRMGAAHIALAASIGTRDISVHRRARVAILATGDELQEIGLPLGPGQIYNSNSHGLCAAVRELGATPIVLRPASDDATALRTTFKEMPDVHLILSSGGVSVGDFDYVKTVVEELGSIDFWRIRMRPGKPLMVGTVGSGDRPPTRILGLPGNPTSTMVTFFVFARPLILKLMGLNQPVSSPVRAIAGEPLDNRGGRETYFRIVLSYDGGEPVARLAGGQDSSMLTSLARANGLARVDADRENVAAGESVDVYPLHFA